jgi:hypothetical protein
VGEAFARALTLCRELENDNEIFPVLYGLWVHRLNRAEYAAAGETAREFMERAEQGKDAGVILIGHTLVGSVWLMQGGSPRRGKPTSGRSLSINPGATVRWLPNT